MKRAFSLSWTLSGYWIIWIGYSTRVLNKIMTLFGFKYRNLWLLTWCFFLLLVEGFWLLTSIIKISVDFCLSFLFMFLISSFSYPCSSYFHALMLPALLEWKLSPLNDTGKDWKLHRFWKVYDFLCIKGTWLCLICVCVTIRLITPVKGIGWLASFGKVVWISWRA